MTDLINAVADTVKTTITSGGGDIASSFTNFIWNNYITSSSFWGMMILVYLFIWISRVLIFDNKNLSVNSKSWFYPSMFFVIVLIAVWLKNDATFDFSKKYIADLFTTMGVISMSFVAFGHKMVSWLSDKTVKALGLKEGYSKKEATLTQESDGVKTETQITQTKIEAPKQ